LAVIFILVYDFDYVPAWDVAFAFGVYISYKIQGAERVWRFWYE
jgi:hypothetical protein